uniref:Ribosomal protein S21e n=1 Tax=Amorphochlora amoebiformis TaxID=1561963 RepID=A0A0H5BIG5_9EUKA|nr:ribosomal protein S21e [Amorphochlora amoebiformis]
MYNKDGELIEEYIPLVWYSKSYSSWSKKVINPSEKKNLLLKIRHFDKNLKSLEKYSLIVICTKIRAQGISDMAIEYLLSRL